MYDLLTSIRVALESVDLRYCQLSELDYQNTAPSSQHFAKFQERAFAYEFYHQLRILMDAGKCTWSGQLQAEVSKEYQHIFDRDIAPDFLIHTPDSPSDNVAVLEVKLAKRPTEEILEDFRKLLMIRASRLKYDLLVQIIIGTGAALDRKREWILAQNTPNGERIDVFLRDTVSGTVEQIVVLASP